MVTTCPQSVKSVNQVTQLVSQSVSQSVKSVNQVTQLVSQSVSQSVTRNIKDIKTREDWCLTAKLPITNTRSMKSF